MPRQAETVRLEDDARHPLVDTECRAILNALELLLGCVPCEYAPYEAMRCRAISRPFLSESPKRAHGSRPIGGSSSILPGQFQR